MSRSFKKPFASWVSYLSNKKDKKLAHKSFRAKEREGMNNILEEDGEFHGPNKMKEVSNTYNFSSDGLPHYEGFTDIKEKQMRNFGWLKWFKK